MSGYRLSKLPDSVSIPDSPTSDEIDLPMVILDELLKDDFFYVPTEIVDKASYSYGQSNID